MFVIELRARDLERFGQVAIRPGVIAGQHADRAEGDSCYLADGSPPARCLEPRMNPQAEHAQLQSFAVDSDHPVSKCPASPFAPIWIGEMDRGQR